MTTAESVHPSVRRWTQREEKDHGDLLYVDGREKLPHVGVVTEKSAAYWLSAAAREPAARANMMDWVATSRLSSARRRRPEAAFARSSVPRKFVRNLERSAQYGVRCYAGTHVLTWSPRT